MSKRIGKAQVLATLHELVDEFGSDHVYESPDRFADEPEGPSCFYSNADGSPSCVAGHVFSRLTPELYDAIRNTEDVTHRSFSLGAAETVSIPVAGGSLTYVKKHLTKGAIRVLASMQAYQDSGDAWGLALNKTERDES